MLSIENFEIFGELKHRSRSLGPMGPILLLPAFSLLSQRRPS